MRVVLLLALLAAAQLDAQNLDTLLKDLQTTLKRVDTTVSAIDSRLTTLETNTGKEWTAIKTSVSNLGAQQAHEMAGLKIRMTQLVASVQAQTSQLTAGQQCCQASANDRKQQITAVLSAISSLQSVKPTMLPVGPGVGTSNAPEGCLALYNQGFTTVGAYNIDSDQLSVARVWCDSGYTTILRRSNGVEKFDRVFSSYVTGFGDVAADHWIGLATQHYLTSSAPAELVIEFFIDMDSSWNQDKFFKRYPADTDGKLKHVRAAVFAVGAGDDYTLRLDQLSTNLNNTFTAEYTKKLSGKAFSALKRDRDGVDRLNCAAKYGGGFWDICSAYVWPTTMKAASAGYTCGAQNPVCARVYPYMARSVHMKIRR